MAYVHIYISMGLWYSVAVLGLSPQFVCTHEDGWNQNIKAQS